MADIDKVAAFSADKAVDKIRERIRGALADLIPDEQWDAMIRAEVKDYLEDKTVDRSGYNQHYQTVSAGFKRVVRDELTRETKERLKAFFDSAEWQGEWKHDGGQNYVTAGKAVNKLVTENASVIIASVLGEAIQNVISNMRNQLR